MATLTRFIIIGVITILVVGCTGQSKRLYTQDFRYEDVPVFQCIDVVVEPTSVLADIQNRIKRELANQGLDDLSEYLDFMRPDFIGFKQYADQVLIKFLFTEVTQDSAKLSGEGGVGVVVNLCNLEQNFYVYKFHM